MKRDPQKLRCPLQLGKVPVVRAIRLLLLAGLTAFWVVLPGCGYRLKVPVNEVFARPSGIFVPVFDNRSEEVGAERVFTNALIREIQNRREIVLASSENSGAELHGTIASIEYSPTAASALGFKGLQGYRRIPTELGVKVTLHLILIENGTQRTLWAKTFFGFRRVNAPVNRTFNYESPSITGPFSQSLAESLYSEVARDIMRDVYDEMMVNL